MRNIFSTTKSQDLKMGREEEVLCHEWANNLRQQQVRNNFDGYLLGHIGY